MAKAKTFELEHKGYFWGNDGCKICGKKIDDPYRLFYYPTFMNGDAEWIADFCKNHKIDGLKMLKILNNSL